MAGCVATTSAQLFGLAGKCYASGSSWRPSGVISIAKVMSNPIGNRAWRLQGGYVRAKF